MYRLVVSTLLCAFSLYTFSQQEGGAKTKSIMKDSVMLKEVVVKSSRPISRLDTEGVVTKIQGTILQDVGTANDLLGYLPGIVKSGDNIEVFGKGSPVIYINGRRVRSSQELGQLRSVQIKDVTVINNPGAKYSSEINAVIRITTVKERGEGFAFENSATVGVRNYVYAKDILWMNYRKGGLDVFSSMEYDYSKGRGRNASVQDSWSAASKNQTFVSASAHKRSQLYNGKVGFNYVAGANHSFGLFGEVTHTPERRTMLNMSEITKNGILDITEENEMRKKTDDTQYLVDGYYSGKWGKWLSDVTFSLLWHDVDDGVHVSPLSPDMSGNTVKTDDKSRGSMYAGKVALSRPYKTGSFSFGTEITHSRRTDLFASAFDAIPSNDDKLEESNFGGYAEWQQRFGKAALQLGMRYEHINSDYYDHGVKVDEQSHSYDEFLPSASLMLPVSKSALQLSYARKYTRPLYGQLSSTVVYFDQCTYEAGNPFLKTTYHDNVSLNYKWNWLMLMLQYQHTSRQIEIVTSDYNGNPDITLISKKNSEKGRNTFQCMAQIQPGMIKNVYFPVLALGIVAQDYSIEFCGKEKKMNNPMGIVKWMNIFMLPGRLRLNGNFSFRTEGDSDNIHMGQTWQFDFSASRPFGKNVEAKLTANDIFNTAADNKFLVYSGTRSLEMSKHSSLRSIELNVVWRFNVDKKKYKGAGAGVEERRRL